MRSSDAIDRKQQAMLLNSIIEAATQQIEDVSLAAAPTKLEEQCLEPRPDVAADRPVRRSLLA